MQMKKLFSAALASCLTAGSMLGTGAFQSAAAADPALTFDIRSDGKNEITIKAEDIAARDISVPVSIFIPSNPGVSGINLKMQINDGQIDETDHSFGNYGLYFAEGAMASPFCFDSASKGDAGASFSDIFTPTRMNLSWVYSADPAKLPDAAAEANTVAWDSTVNWAYDNAFATATLVVPKNTPAGEYKLDIRKDPYINAQSVTVASAKESRSVCYSGKEEKELSFNSIPLTVKVAETDNGNWTDTYEIADGGHYYIIGDVAAKAGETAKVPVYVFNDIGTAGYQLFFDVDKRTKLTQIDRGTTYRAAPTINTELDYPSVVYAGYDVMHAKNGVALCYLNVTVPADAKAGDNFKVGFYHEGKDNSILKIVDIDGEKLDVKFFDGSVTVIDEGATALNRTSASLSGADQYTNLTLFNTTGAVTWKSEDPSVATVDQNGMVKSVGFGTTKVTATCGGKDYVCNVVVGLLGDVDRNGEVSSSDAQLVLWHYVDTMAGKQGRFGEELYAIADVDADGVISVMDAQNILKYYVNNTVSKKNVSWDEILHPTTKAAE